jgi:hypothetical protein
MFHQSYRRNTAALPILILLLANTISVPAWASDQLKEETPHPASPEKPAPTLHGEAAATGSKAVNNSKQVDDLTRQFTPSWQTGGAQQTPSITTPRVPAFSGAAQAAPAIGAQNSAAASDFHKLIAQSKQTIVSENIVYVNAYCATTSTTPGDGRTEADPWTAANMTLKPGQRLWLATEGNASWNWTDGATCGPDGLGSNCGDNSCLFTSVPQSTASLVAYVGTTPPPGSQPGQIVWNATTYSDPKVFAVGDYKENLSPGTGQIYFMPNDNALGDNSGLMPVRVIITQPKKK